jgi:hypothetical protein
MTPIGGPGLFGFGAGGHGCAWESNFVISPAPAANSGGGGNGRTGGGTQVIGTAGASGYCLINWWQ